MATSPPSLPRLAVYPRSPSDWAPLLVGGVVVIGLVLGNFNKYFLAGSSKDSPVLKPVSEAATAQASPTALAPISVSGRAGSLRVVAVAQLPSRPGALRMDPNCESVGMKPVSSQAETASAAGWRVLSEQVLTGYQVVMVDAGIERQSNGQCMSIGTSVLIFREANLTAIAYSRNTPKAVRLSGMAQLGTDEIRLDGVRGPVARLVLASDKILLAPIP